MHGAQHSSPVPSALFCVDRVGNGHRESLVVDFADRWMADEKFGLGWDATQNGIRLHIGRFAWTAWSDQLNWLSKQDKGMSLVVCWWPARLHPLLRGIIGLS